MVHVIRIGPNEYIHVLDNNANITRLLEGPITYTRKEHERIVAGPLDKITLPPNHYAVVRNAVVRDEDGDVVKDSVGMAALKFGDTEVRLSSNFSEPFVLYPGEELVTQPTELPTVAPNTALRLKAIRPVYADDGTVKRSSGEEWLFYGVLLKRSSKSCE